VKIRSWQRQLPDYYDELPKQNRDDGLSVETYTIEDQEGKPLYVANFNLWVLKLRLYAAVVDDRLVIASRSDIVAELMAALHRGGRNQGGRKTGKYGVLPLSFAFQPAGGDRQLGMVGGLRHACQQNLPLVAILLKPLGFKMEMLFQAIFGILY
jgi:hypothetical protein